MKRCMFSGTLIEEFRWTDGGEHICYTCHQRKKDHKHNEGFKKSLAIEQLLLKAAAIQIKKKKKAKKTNYYPKVKVDNRILEMGVIPKTESGLHGFKLRPETEGPIHTTHN
ncbi:hypothetical protein HY988_02505 [Candidatus Micrarchaeota archaeon]|nr:hypothetical protein [Candidatus Micrarchaeota archaeon]